MRNKKQIYKSIAFFILTTILVGCSSVGIGIPGQATAVQPSDTLPEVSIIPTSTPTLTATPTITPTSTKVPDLEIYNSQFIESPNGPQGVHLLGNIRNNTDVPIILPSREYAFIFNFNGYETYGDEFMHYWGGPKGLKPGIEVQSCNCILYPHEIGVIFFNIGYLDELPGYISKEEVLQKYDGPLGLFYTYTSAYKPAPDLPTKYHPKAENVKFNIADGNIFFEYDINVPAPKQKETEKGMVRGFLTMYDRDGKIVNFLYHEDIAYYLPWEHPYDNYIHMLGQSPDGDVPVHWQSYLEITVEQLQKVDHIELLIETQYEGICFNKRFTE